MADPESGMSLWLGFLDVEVTGVDSRESLV